MEGKLTNPSAFAQLVKLIKGLFNTASQARKVTLGTSWDYDSTNGYYTQSVLVVGMKATDTPQLSVEISTLSDADSINEEFAKVIDAETYDGGIKFYAKSATTRNLTVVIKPDLSKVTVDEMSSEDFTKKIIVDSIYPVGSIYMSVNDVNPTTLFGGTWEKIKDKFLLASGDSYELGAIGGETEHTLTVEEMPAHRHIAVMPVYQSGATTNTTNFILNTSARYSYQGGKTVYNQMTSSISSVGGSQSHNNMPPYLTVNVWKRTA